MALDGRQKTWATLPIPTQADILLIPCPHRLSGKDSMAKVAVVRRWLALFLIVH